MNVKQLFDITKEVALCTGATSGIGKRMAQVLAQAGANVVLLGRQKDVLKQVSADISVYNSNVAYIATDLSHRENLASVVKQANEFFGTPTILINAAGINLREPYDEISLATWDKTLGINLATPFFLARECAPAMIAKGRGRIINIASLQSYRAFANSIAYGASKGGVAQLTRAMAEAWSKDGITANAIAPGFIRTPLTEKVYNNKELAQHNADMTAIGRNGELEDLDGITIFLASRASDYITGQVISLDGGYTAK